MISAIDDMIVNVGENVTFYVTVDANPPADIRVTPQNAKSTVVNATTVFITISAVTTSAQYTVTANNSVGADTESFQLTVIGKVSINMHHMIIAI